MFYIIRLETHVSSRSSFRGYAAEQTHTPHAVMEAALAHTIKNAAEAPGDADGFELIARSLRAGTATSTASTIRAR